MNKEFTDRDYAKFLFDWVWKDKDDACAKCAFMPKNTYGICKNEEADINICFEGIKKYAMDEYKRNKK